MTKIMEFCENPDKHRYYDFEVGYNLKKHFGRETPVVGLKYHVYNNTINKLYYHNDNTFE